MAQKTNAARLLDQLGIRYELREYEVDPDDLAAETVARKIATNLIVLGATRFDLKYGMGGLSHRVEFRSSR